jgi:hypothetical protein
VKQKQQEREREREEKVVRDKGEHHFIFTQKDIKQFPINFSTFIYICMLSKTTTKYNKIQQKKNTENE